MALLDQQAVPGVADDVHVQVAVDLVHVEMDARRRGTVLPIRPLGRPSGRDRLRPHVPVTSFHFQRRCKLPCADVSCQAQPMPRGMAGPFDQMPPEPPIGKSLPAMQAQSQPNAD